MAGVPAPGLDLIKTFEGLSLQAYPDPKNREPANHYRLGVNPRQKWAAL